MKLNQDMIMNKFTLSFKQPLEKEYQALYFKDSIVFLRIALVFVSFLYGIFGYLDNSNAPHFTELFHSIRFAIVIPFILLVIIISYFKFFEKIWQHSLVAASVIGGWGIAVMLSKLPDNISYYGGMILIFSACYFFIRQRFIFATFSGWLILIIVNILIIGYSTASTNLIVAYNFFYVSANLINMFAAYNIEYNSRRNFFLNYQLNLHKTELEASNKSLESQVEIRTHQLSDNEKKYRQLVEDIDDILFSLDANGNISFISPVVTKVTGFPVSDFLGKHYSKFVNSSEVLDNSFLMARSDSYEDFKVVTAAGETVWLRNNLYRIILDDTSIEYRGISRNITESKLAEDALLSSREKFKQLIELAVDGVLIGSNDGYILDANSCVCEMLGRTREELIGKHVTDSIFTEKSLSDTPLQFERLNRGEVVISERSLFSPDGRETIIEMRTKMMPDKTYQSIYRDVTQRKMAEIEISNKNIELAELNASKDKFFSIIAHDLRTPFSGLLGLSRVLSENIDDLHLSDLRELSTNIKVSADSLFKLLENLLEWSRIQRNLISINLEIASVYYIVKQNIDIANEYAKLKMITIINNVPESAEAVADIPMLNTILRNIISNAVKFTPEKGTIEIGAITNIDKKTIIFIKDSGIGMPAELMQKLFKLEEKVSRLGTNDEPSTGLGLILCKEFVEKQGGEIWVESQENIGTTFFVSLLN